MDEFEMTHEELHKKVAWASEKGISSLTFTIEQLGSLAKVYASAQERIEELEQRLIDLDHDQMDIIATEKYKAIHQGEK